MTPVRTGTARLTLCALIGAGFMACDSPSAPPVPALLVATSGEAQSGIAGTALVTRPGVRVEDARGRPIPDVPVVFVVVEGGGTLEFGAVVTDGTGAASPGSWVLGPRVGMNVLTATVEGLPPVEFTANAIPGAPAVLRVHAGGAQSTTVGERVPVSPAVLVLDANENPVPGAPVTFSVAIGDGLLVGASANGSASATTVTLATDAEGMAAPTSWQLGSTAGTHALEARVAGMTGVATFVATAEPGPAADLSALAGGAQTAAVGEHAPIAPGVRVTDTFGNAIQDIDITFTVLAGSGALSAAGTVGAENITIASNAAGMASLEAWQLGTRAGANQVEARAEGVSEGVRFDAFGTPGPAAQATAHAGDLQVATAGSSVPVAPAVYVADSYGNSVPGVFVTFEITEGGGALAAATGTTDVDGVAAAGDWNLGPLPGPNSITALIDGLDPVSFTATGTPTSGGGSGGGGSGGGGSGGGSPGGFTIEMRYTTGLAGSQLAAFNAAADRWASVITGDLADVFVTVSAGGCGAPHPAVAENIDDVVIFVTVQSIDGPGKILGSAGPCRIRSGSGLPALGVIYLDSDDLGGLDTNGLLEDVIVHEMGHVLGIGTLWPSGLIVGAGGSDPAFTGTSAVSHFLGAGGSAYSGTPVPVENTGGPGTKDAHWRESVMASEIMTGWINFGGNPLSGITIGSLQDMGYDVDLGVADGFQMTGVSALGQGGGLEGVEIHEGILPPPVVVNGAANAASTMSSAASTGMTGLFGRYTATKRR